MSNEAIVLSPEEALQVGGVGIGSAMFKGRPMSLELVHKTTRQEGAIPGKFRNIATGEHFDTMRVVLLDSPKEQREYYENDGKTYSKDQKLCFSTNNIQPHARAKQPQALYCATCPMGELIDPKTGYSRAWEKWRQTKNVADLPKCGMFYHLFLADRATQTPYYMNIKGTSVKPFKDSMEQAMFGLLQKIIAQAKMANKQRGYKLVDNVYVPDPVFVLPEGKTERAPLVPMPNIFDISFEIFVTTRDKGGPYVVGLRDFKYMQPAERAEFGALYLDYATRRASGQIGAEAELAAQAEAEFQAAKAATTQASAQQPAVVLPGVPVGPVEGTVVPKDAPITI